MPFRRRADDGHMHAALGDRFLNVAHVGYPEFVGKLLIAPVRPLRPVRVVSDHGQFKARMGRHASRDVVVLDHAEHGASEAVHESTCVAAKSGFVYRSPSQQKTRPSAMDQPAARATWWARSASFPFTDGSRPCSIAAMNSCNSASMWLSPCSVRSPAG